MLKSVVFNAVIIKYAHEHQNIISTVRMAMNQNITFNNIDECIDEMVLGHGERQLRTLASLLSVAVFQVNITMALSGHCGIMVVADKLLSANPSAWLHTKTMAVLACSII